MRARMALWVSETPCFIREVKLSRKPVELIAASPKATVPVIVKPDGGVIDESLSIMRWALAQNDPEAWLERDDPELIAANDGAFKYHLDRYKYSDRHGSNPVEHRAAGLAMLETLEARLSRTCNLCGDMRGITDVAIFPFVRQFAETDRGWFDAQPLPSLRRWLSAHLQSALFCGAMLRLSPWQTGDVPVIFPEV